jgi:2-dehydropantoate 2-reductase
MHIVVIGCGGVGGYFGARLASHGHRVTFVARAGKHLDAVRRTGLCIKSPNGDITIPHPEVTTDCTTIGPVDVVLLCVKLFDLDDALTGVASLLRADTLVIPLQNGMSSVDMMRKKIPASNCCAGTCYILATLVSPGCIVHSGVHRLIFGPSSSTVPATPLMEAFRGTIE